MKKYSQGVILGRFNPLHKGHVHLIQEALKRCQNVLVFIGSSQESRTSRNPFSYEERKAMLEKVFGKAIAIEPLPDLGIGDVHAWGDHIISEAIRLGYKPDAFVLGEENKNTKWFTAEVLKSIDLVEISRQEIPYSSTMLREVIYKGDKEAFRQIVPKELDDYFDFFVGVITSIR